MALTACQKLDRGALPRRLHGMRDRSILQPEYRQVYAHALMVAHMSGNLVAVDDPALERIRQPTTGTWTRWMLSSGR